MNYVLVGGGLTSGRAALTLLEQGVTDPITLITKEAYFPYERPGLSKGYLLGKESVQQLYTDKKTMAEAENLSIITNTEIVRIDRSNKKVISKNGQYFPYDKLLLATGSEPIKLDLPGSKDNTHNYYLRTIDDAKQIVKAIGRAKSAIVVGGSFIGMEVTSSLTQNKIKTTLLHRSKTVFDKLDSPTLSQKFLNYYKKRGAEFILEDEVASFTKTGLVTKKGLRLEADMIVIGVGVRPLTDLAKEAGLAVDDGVIVNEHLQTSDPHIWAGGDIANFPDLASGGKRRRIEHWDVADHQGKYIAKSMLGKKEPYNHLAYFFSDIFDLSFEFFGDPSQSQKTIDIDTWPSYIALYVNDENKLVAAFIMGISDHKKEKIKQAIKTKQTAADDFVATLV